MVNIEAMLLIQQAVIQAAEAAYRSKFELKRLKEEQEGRERARALGPEAELAYESAVAEANRARAEREEKKRLDDLEERRVRALERRARAAERIAEAHEACGSRLLHDWRIV